MPDRGGGRDARDDVSHESQAVVPAPFPLSPGAVGDKHRAAPFRRGFVPRPRLMRRLAGAQVPLVLIVAPAGYGKTTLLAEWAVRDERPFAWLTLDEADADPGRLLAGISRALDGVDPERPFVLVLDQGHALRSPEALQTVAAVAERLCPGSAVALATRGEPPLPVGRLRVHRRVLEVRWTDLAMNPIEAAALLERAGLDLAPTAVEALVRRTEGWAAGLYLAALALREQKDVTRAVARFGGDDRLVADYIRDELLCELTPEEIRFLTATSVLDRLTGPACDALLDQQGSGVLLRELSRSNLLVASVDRSEHGYRYHPLLAQMLLSELRRSEPERETRLHRRASTWHEQQGDADRAIDHAIAARDVDRAAGLLWAIAPAYAFSGRRRALERWLAELGDDDIAGHPSLALTAATAHLVGGDLDAVERLAARAERRLDHAAAGIRASLQAGAGVLRAAAARHGVRHMGELAAGAYARQPEESPWRSLSRLLQGVAEHLTGHLDEADAHLEDGAREGAVAAPHVQVLCLSQLALVALEQDDRDRAVALAARAMAQVDRVGLHDQETCVLVPAVSALVRAHAGRLDEAQRDVRRARRLLAGLGEFAGWYEAEVRVVLALASIRLTDAPTARTFLDQASHLLSRSPDAVRLREWIREGTAQLDRFSVGALMGPSSLTPAELRVLGFLPSHLSFGEIAKLLHVSGNTVKTQAHAVYRKLDVSSRSEAVDRACQCGLVEI